MPWPSVTVSKRFILLMILRRAYLNLHSWRPVQLKRPPVRLALKLALNRSPVRAQRQHQLPLKLLLPSH
eukprot:3050332-Pleurochrysis_carterae.AAC.1